MYKPTVALTLGQDKIYFEEKFTSANKIMYLSTRYII